jgi:hypothetical protein
MNVQALAVKLDIGDYVAFGYEQVGQVRYFSTDGSKVYVTEGAGKSRKNYELRVCDVCRIEREVAA